MGKELGDKIKKLVYRNRHIKSILSGLKYYIGYFKALWYIYLNKKRVCKRNRSGGKLTVVFLVQYIPGWNKLEPIYSRMLQDSRFVPIILCVPSNIQNSESQDNYENDTFLYFMKQGYDAIDTMKADGSWVDVKQFKPDFVFHSRPYNVYMPRQYSSHKIVKYALICNVLYGASMTKNGQDVTLNRDYFKDTFLYFSFDKKEKIFYQKRYRIGTKIGIQHCIPYGAIGLEQVLSRKTNLEGSGHKKSILWTPRWLTDPYIGGSNFFNYKELLVNLAKNNKDVVLIIRPHPLMFANFVKTGEMSSEEVAHFKKTCAEENNIILDESPEYYDTLWNSDFLITDVSGIVPEYYITGKPVIYCHSGASFEYSEYAEEMIRNCYEVWCADDLMQHINELIVDNDYKAIERKHSISTNFDGVEKNSENVLEALKRFE